MALQFNWGAVPKASLPKGALPWHAIPQLAEITVSDVPFWGWGTQLLRGDGASSETFTAMALVRTVDGPTYTLDHREITDVDDGDRVYSAGYCDAGEVSAEILFTLDEYTLAIDDFEDSTSRNYRITMLDGTQITFSGYLIALGQAVSNGEAVLCSVTIKITSQPVLA